VVREIVCGKLICGFRVRVPAGSIKVNTIIPESDLKDCPEQFRHLFSDEFVIGTGVCSTWAHMFKVLSTRTQQVQLAWDSGDITEQDLRDFCAWFDKNPIFVRETLGAVAIALYPYRRNSAVVKEFFDSLEKFDHSWRRALSKWLEEKYKLE
jgi:hypothetical protein